MVQLGFVFPNHIPLLLKRVSWTYFNFVWLISLFFCFSIPDFLLLHQSPEKWRPLWPVYLSPPCAWAWLPPTKCTPANSIMSMWTMFWATIASWPTTLNAWWKRDRVHPKDVNWKVSILTYFSKENKLSVARMLYAVIADFFKEHSDSI